MAKRKFDNFKEIKGIITEYKAKFPKQFKYIETNLLYKQLVATTSAPEAHWRIAEYFYDIYIVRFGIDFITEKLKEDEELNTLIPNLIDLCKVHELSERDYFSDFLVEIGYSEYSWFEKLKVVVPFMSVVGIDIFARKFYKDKDLLLELCILASWYINSRFSEEDEVREFCSDLTVVLYKHKIYDTVIVASYINKFLKLVDFYFPITIDFFIPQKFPKDGNFLLPWKYVIFYNGYVKLEHPTSGALFPFNLKGSKAAFNTISSYIKRKLPPLYVSAKNNIIDKVFKPDLLSKVIEILDKKTSAPDIVITPKKRKQYQQMTNDELRKEIKQLKSQYLDYLSERQDDEFKLLYCIERKTHQTVDEAIEDSFIFTIKVGRLTVVVHENLDVNRSSIVFYIKPLMYETAIKKIHSFFASDIVNKRQLIASNNIHFKDSGIVALERIMHTDFHSWKSRIDEL